MESPEPDNPFAEFAEPRLSAVEELKLRQHQEAEQARRRYILAACMLVGSALGAGLAAGATGGVVAIGYAIALGGVGAVIGLLFGWLVGAMTWAGIRLGRTTGPAMPNTTSTLSVWMNVWGLLGITLGTAAGAFRGRLLAEGPTQPDENLVALGFVGAVLGAVLAFALGSKLLSGRR